MGYLVDSNVIIDYLAFRFKGDSLSAINNIINQELNISVITKIEVLGFTSGVKDLDIKTEQFVALANLFELSHDVIDKTIQIRKKRKIKIADAIIAATALTNGLRLLSHNTKDFVGIKGLAVLDPYTL